MIQWGSGRGGGSKNTQISALGNWMDSIAIYRFRDIKGRTGLGGWGGKDECSRDMLNVKGCGIAGIEFELVLIRVTGLVIEISKYLCTVDEEPLPREAPLPCSPFTVLLALTYPVTKAFPRSGKVDNVRHSRTTPILTG